MYFFKFKNHTCKIDFKKMKGVNMPRTQRIQSSLRIYHVVIKGADRQLLFEEEKDFKKYLKLLEYFKQECEFEIFAYCLMSNHVHLLIRHSPDSSLETIFRKLNTTYAVWFNMKYERTGYVQNGRYFSDPIENINSLLAVARYIHYNPTNAGLEKSPGNSYRWSSYRDYINVKKDSSSLTDTDFFLALLGDRKNFQEYHSKNPRLSNETFLDIDCITKRIPDDVAKEIIYEISGCNTTTEFQNLSLVLRDKYIKEIHQKGPSIRQMNRLLGIPRGVIERILVKK